MRVRGQQILSCRRSGGRQREHVRIFLMPFFLASFWGQLLRFGVLFVCFFPLCLLSLISLLQTLVCIFLGVFSWGSPRVGRAGGYTAPGVTCTGKEPGIPAAGVEFCLAGGNSGHSLSSLDDWAANQSWGWLFLCADSGTGCWLLYCHKSGFRLLGTRCLQLMS